MHTKEAAKKWNVTVKQVAKYCSEGMVLFAEKDGGNWNIPDDAEKPMISRSTACKLMSMIETYQEGNKPSFKGCGFSISQIDEYYEYLADNGFISTLSDGASLNEKLINVKILNAGKELIEKFNKSNPERAINISAEIYGEVNIGVLKAGAKVNVDKNDQL